jgi:hypothetical protein
VNSLEGSHIFVNVEDVSPLTEVAPTHEQAMDILRYSWLNSMENTSDQAALMTQMNTAINSLSASFKGTDAATFLEFLGSFLREADSKARIRVWTMIIKNTNLSFYRCFLQIRAG